MTHEIKKGFTLIEILISVGIMAVISILIAQAFFATTRSNTKTELVKDIKQNGDFAVSIMERMIRNARSITSECTSSGTVSKSLTFVNPDNVSTTFTCVLDGSETRIASTSAGRTDFLTSDDLTLNNPTFSDVADCSTSTMDFTCRSFNDAPNSIKITFSLFQKGDPKEKYERASASFQTTVSLRSD